MSSSHLSPASFVSVCPDVRQHQSLRGPLREHLLSLPFPAFLTCIERLLLAQGFREVQPRRARVGARSYGGHDLEGSLSNGLLRSRFLAQAKQYREPVPRTYVDELRGALMRSGTPQGMLFTTSTFSPAARLAADSGPLLPVRLIEGEELLDLLLSHHIGICPQPRAPGHWGVDEMFFARLAHSG